MKIAIPDRFTIIHCGRWTRFYDWRERDIDITKPIRCLVCQHDLRRDKTVLVSEGRDSQVAIFMCNDGLRCSGRARRGQLKVPTHKTLKGRDNRVMKTR